jgi:hypothetical protein
LPFHSPSSSMPCLRDMEVHTDSLSLSISLSLSSYIYIVVPE